MSQKPSPTVTIALVWHQMNSDNLGVGALTVSNIALLRQAAERAGCTPKFIILGWKDPRPWYHDWDDVENVPLRTRHLPRPGGPLGAALRRADIVLDIGGGDSFTDLYGAKRFLTVWVTKWRAVLAGKPLILSPQTIGPFESFWAKTLARHAMNKAKFVTTRDLPSTDFLQSLGVRSELLEATDVAMGLPYTPPAQRRPDDPIRVGLNVSGLMMSGGYTGANQFGLSTDYPALIRDIIRWFQSQSNVEVHLVGHVQSETQPVEDDQRVNVALGQEFAGTVVAPVFESPSEAKTYIAGMDFFMGSRMHATIAAFSTGVPVVPMAYSRKFAGVFGTLGYDHVADCRSDSADTIMRKIQTGFANRTGLAAEVTTAMEGVNARLEKYVERTAHEIRSINAV